MPPLPARRPRPASPPQAPLPLRERAGAAAGGPGGAVLGRPGTGQPLRAADAGAGDNRLGPLPARQGEAARRPQPGGRGPRGAVAGPSLLAATAALLAGRLRGGPRRRRRPRPDSGADPTGGARPALLANG